MPMRGLIGQIVPHGVVERKVVFYVNPLRFFHLLRLPHHSRLFFGSCEYFADDLINMDGYP